MTATGVIFDLDNCLAPAKQIGVASLQPAFDAIMHANDGSVSSEELRDAFSDIWIHSYDQVAKRYGFTPAMFDAGWREMSRLTVSHRMSGYGDLATLASLPGSLFLVTTGFRRLQESKIAALDIAKYFREIHIDAIDEPNHPGKAALFEQIVAHAGLKKSRTFVVGDNPESELKAARKLGLVAVQMLRPDVVRAADVDHHVADLAELDALLKRRG